MATAYQPTPDQQKAIDARGQNILVNAGAGAGKTATLIERVYRLITDERAPVSLENMLIVTFTRAAATEMKERLAHRLRAELAAAWETAGNEERAARLQSELTLLPRAPISTLHSFCLRLLREHSDAAGLPPDFDLISEEEAFLIHGERIDSELEQVLHEPDWAPALREILEQLLPDPELKIIAGLMRRVHSFLQASADPHGFVAMVLADYEQAADPAIPFEQKRLGMRVRDAIMAPIDRAQRAIAAFLHACPGNGIVAKGPLEYHRAVLALREALATARNIEASQPLPDFESILKLPRRSAITKNSTSEECDLNAESARLKEELDAARDELGKLDPNLSLEALLAQVASTLPYVRLFLVRLGLQFIDDLMAHHMRMRRLTYAHLERLALRVLVNPDGTPTESALSLRNEFEYVLVDEFQDVNELQSQLLAAVSRASTPHSGGGNLFVVGDVKQSIYGFRQAEPRQFLALQKTFADYDVAAAAHPGARLNLRENFRSQPALLRALNDFFSGLFCERIGNIRYDDTHAFVPGRPETSGTASCVDVHLLEKDAPDHDNTDTSDSEQNGADLWMESDEAEAMYIARLVRDCGHPLKDIAILLRSSSGYATKLVEAFQSCDIPFFTQESIGFLGQQEVIDVLSILRVIDNPYEEVALVGCLRGPAAEWNENDLVHLRLHDRSGRLFDNIKAIAAIASHELAPRAAAFLNQLRAWQEASRSEGMGVFFGRLYTDLSLRERVATLPNGNQRVHNLQFLHERGVQFDSFRRKGLGHFLAFLDNLLERGEDLGQPALVSPDSNVVRIMTIHKSKGLEFPVVIVPFLGKSFNRADLNAQLLWDRNAGFIARFLPGRKYGDTRTSIARQLLLPILEDRLRSEELRLLYVAMTRAREKLLLVGSCRKMAEKIARAQLNIPRTTAAKEEATACASSYLDWTLLGLSHRAEFANLSADTPHITIAGGINLHFEPDPRAAAQITSRRLAITADEQLARLADALPEIEISFQRIARRLSREEIPCVRAKVSATEAKRAYESLHNAENPPAHPIRHRRTNTADETPAWWPASLAANRRPDARTKGTLTHRLAALLDLESIARGQSVFDELQRLVIEKYFSPEEAGAVLSRELQHFFAETELGIRVLQSRATVRRELPFTISLDIHELAPAHPAPDDKLIFQGIVDLVFFEKHRANADRLVLVDFKTDYWDGTASHWEQLETAYRPQMQLYRLGLERALGRPVDEVWLYFLTAQQPLLVEAPANSDWSEYLRAAYLRGRIEEEISQPAG